jgi:hypothetical protein
LDEIVLERSTPAGRNTSPQKMMFKNKSAISTTTLQRIEIQKVEDDNAFDSLDQQVDNRWAHLSHFEKDMLSSNQRVGYRLDHNTLTYKPKLINKKNISRGALVTILEEAFKEYENYESIKEDASQSHNSNKQDEGHLDSIHDTIPTVLQNRPDPAIFDSMRPTAPVLNISTSKVSKFMPTDTRPYIVDRLSEVDDTLIIKQNILQRPSTYTEYRMSGELTTGKHKCH